MNKDVAIFIDTNIAQTFIGENVYFSKLGIPSQYYELTTFIEENRLNGRIEICFPETVVKEMKSHMIKGFVYFEIDSKERQLQVGEAFEGTPHLWFEDEEFVKTFSDSEIDYLIRYTPYKHYTAYAVEDVSHLNLPQAVIYDLKHIDIPLTVYNSALMESAEF